jgi:hypothetical protein
MKSSLITPTTVCDSPLSRIARPITAGSPPNRRCQSGWLRITRSVLPSRISSGVKARPNAGTSPSTRKKSSVTRKPVTLSGSLIPVMLTSHHANPATDSSVSLCRFQSTRFAGAIWL